MTFHRPPLTPCKEETGPKIIEAIAAGKYEDVRLKIVGLVTDAGMTARQVLGSLNGEIQWPETTGERTKVKLMTMLLRQIIPQEDRLAHNAEHVVREVIQGSNEELRQKIVRLFTINEKTPQQILEELNGEIPWPPKISEKTKDKRMRAIIEQLVDFGTRERIRIDRNKRVLLSSAMPKANTARAEWMEKKGMHVWTPEETYAFFQLMRYKPMWRTSTRRNHQKIAEALEGYFGKPFTKKVCMDHFLYLKHYKKMDVPDFTLASDSMPSLSPVSTPTKPVPALPGIVRKKGESMEKAAARTMAATLQVSTHPQFSSSALSVMEGNWLEAASTLRSIAGQKDVDNWKPVQHEFYALVLLNADPCKREEATRHLEFGRRKMANGEQSFLDIIMLAPEMAGGLLALHEQSEYGHVARSKRHLKGQ